jgi:hypothetical protein
MQIFPFYARHYDDEAITHSKLLNQDQSTHWEYHAASLEVYTLSTSCLCWSPLVLTGRPFLTFSCYLSRKFATFFVECQVSQWRRNTFENFYFAFAYSLPCAFSLLQFCQKIQFFSLSFITVVEHYRNLKIDN